MRQPFVARQFESEWISASPRVPAHRQKLMIVLHGYGDSLKSFRSIKDELRLPGMNYLLLNAPRRFRKGYSWYPLEPRHAPGILRARQLLFELIEDLKEVGWKTSDLYFIGHSQGALIVSDLLLHHSEAFGGVVGISGYVWFPRGWKAKTARSAAMRTPWLMTYGLRDRLIPPTEIREDIETLWKGGIPVLARAFAKGHDFDFSEEIPFVRRWLAAMIDVASNMTARRRASQAHPLPSVIAWAKADEQGPFTEIW